MRAIPIVSSVNVHAIYNSAILGPDLKPSCTGTLWKPFCYDESIHSLEWVVTEALIQASARLTGIVYFDYDGKITRLIIGICFKLNPAKMYYLRNHLRDPNTTEDLSLRDGVFMGNVPGFGPLVFGMYTDDI